MNASILCVCGVCMYVCLSHIYIYIYIYEREREPSLNRLAVYNRNERTVSFLHFGKYKSIVSLNRPFTGMNSISPFKETVGLQIFPNVEHFTIHRQTHTYNDVRLIRHHWLSHITKLVGKSNRTISTLKPLIRL